MRPPDVWVCELARSWLSLGVAFAVAFAACWCMDADLADRFATRWCVVAGIANEFANRAFSENVKCNKHGVFVILGFQNLQIEV